MYGCRNKIYKTYDVCRSLVVVKTFKIGSDCSFAKSTAFRSENNESFRYDLKNRGPVLQ
jgi:hypothetical protein